MCRAAKCNNCSKMSWVGCGLHIDDALRGIPVEERCKDWRTGKCSMEHLPVLMTVPSKPVYLVNPPSCEREVKGYIDTIRRLEGSYDALKKGFEGPPSADDITSTTTTTGVNYKNSLKEEKQI